MRYNIHNIVVNNIQAYTSIQLQYNTDTTHLYTFYNILVNDYLPLVNIIIIIQFFGNLWQSYHQCQPQVWYIPVAMFSTTVWTCLDCFCSIKQKLRSRHAAFMEVNNKDCRKQTSLLEPTPSNGHLPRAMGYIDTYACTNMHIYTQLHMHIESK